jgi:RNA polymerase sigma-54 factor
MNLGMHLGMSVRMEQKLSPQMIQSLKLLQVNAMELEMLIKEELEINPVLELEEEAESRIEDSPTNEAETPEPSESEPNAAEEINWDEYFNDGFDIGYKVSEDLSKPDPDDNFERTPTYGQTLDEYLTDQLKDRKTDALTASLIKYLIGCLDDDGYLRPAQSEDYHPDILDQNLTSEIELILAGEKDLEKAVMPIREAFHILQSFDPPGIGARNLKECFLIQARRITGFNPLALTILEFHFDLLEKLKLTQLAKKLQKDQAEVQKALHSLTRLTPHPGRLISDSKSSTIIPDLMVERDKNGVLQVLLNDRSQPRLRISSIYQKLMQKKSASADEKKFIREKLNSANWLIKSIDQRKATMVRVMEAILDNQREFFEKGPEHLKPMILQDIADKIEMHISTVNRVTNGKYVQTETGVFELKHFFSAAVTQDDGSEVSATQAKTAIKSLVDAEDPVKPLSDQKIVETLEAQGIQVARRTVSKYREQMNILPARLRKKF